MRPPARADEVFFIEDLVHQCGHILFNALTLNPAKWLAIDPKTPLSRLTSDLDDSRAVYVALHGVFTECLMSIALAQCFRLEIFEGRQRHELQGRLSLIMRRLQLDLQSVRNPGLCTEAGFGLVAAFAEVFDQVFELARDAIVACDLRNQPYSFCYEKFVALNPAD